MTKLFPNSPGNYYNHNPTSGYDQELIIITIIDQNSSQINLVIYPTAQETIIIIAPTRRDLKNKLSYSPIAQETITITAPDQKRPQ